MLSVFQPEYFLKFLAGMIARHNIQKPFDFRGDFHGDFHGDFVLFQGFRKNRMNRKFNQEKGPIVICVKDRFKGKLLLSCLLTFPLKTAIIFLLIGQSSRM